MGESKEANNKINIDENWLENRETTEVRKRPWVSETAVGSWLKLERINNKGSSSG